ncbi:MAG: hypothetical protein CMB80_11305 [Flammeovirgaceae bacterium]|nr:hypothetical protein [Flammeovirgaceae bacterium]
MKFEIFSISFPTIQIGKKIQDRTLSPLGFKELKKPLTTSLGYIIMTTIPNSIKLITKALKITDKVEVVISEYYKIIL